jgi:chromosome segregation ATPase
MGRRAGPRKRAGNTAQPRGDAAAQEQADRERRRQAALAEAEQAVAEADAAAAAASTAELDLETAVERLEQELADGRQGLNNARLQARRARNRQRQARQARDRLLGAAVDAPHPRP